jgi:predicted DNA-binding transcriptional regulator AlpA
MSEAEVGVEKTGKRFFRIRQVIDATGLSRTTIYRKIAEGSFPPQIKLGDRAVGWKDSDVYAWMDQRERLSRDCRLRSERVRLASLRRSHFR